METRYRQLNSFCFQCTARSSSPTRGTEQFSPFWEKGGVSCLSCTDTDFLVPACVGYVASACLMDVTDDLSFAQSPFVLGIMLLKPVLQSLVHAD